MFRLPRALPFLFAAGVVLCSCAAAQADEPGDVRPPDATVTAEPRDVRVDAPDTYVESAPEWVVVCVGEVRVVIGPGGCPVPPPAFLPEPVPEPGRVFPEVLAPSPVPVPVPEAATAPAPAGAAAAPPAAPESPAPEGPGPETPPAPEPAEPTDPFTTVEAALAVETAHQEPLLAADRPTADDTASGAFTPMRTMVIIAVVGAVAATGAGRAGATRRG